MRTILVLLTLTALGVAQEANDAEKLFRDAWWQETGAGSLDRALDLYEKAAAADGPAAVRAKALLRGAMLHHRLGNKEKAIQLADSLIERFPGQTEVVDEARLKLEVWTAVDLRMSYGEWYRRYLFTPEFQKRIVDWVLDLGADKIDARANLLSVGEAAVPALREALKSGNAELKNSAVEILILSGDPPDIFAMAEHDRWMDGAQYWIALMRLPVLKRVDLKAPDGPDSIGAKAVKAALGSPEYTLKFLATDEGTDFGRPWRNEDEGSPNRALALLSAARELGGLAVRSKLADLAVNDRVHFLMRRQAVRSLIEFGWPAADPVQLLAWAGSLETENRDDALRRIAREAKSEDEALLDAMLVTLLADDGQTVTADETPLIWGLAENPAVPSMMWNAERAGILVECAAIENEGPEDYILESACGTTGGAEAVADAILARIGRYSRRPPSSKSRLRAFGNRSRTEVRRPDGSVTTWNAVWAERAAALWSGWQADTKRDFLRVSRSLGIFTTEPPRAGLARLLRRDAADRSLPAGLRAYILEVLGATDLKSITAHLDLSKPDEIAAAMRFLEDFPASTSTINAFRGALKHPSVAIRWSLLHHYEQEGALDEYIATFAPLTSDPSPEIRVKVVHAIASWSSMAALPYLHAAAGDSVADVRQWAAAGLSQIGHETCLPYLKKLMTDPDATVRKTAYAGYDQIKRDRMNREITLRPN